jgi:hypothetical protein
MQDLLSLQHADYLLDLTRVTLQAKAPGDRCADLSKVRCLAIRLGL